MIIIIPNFFRYDSRKIKEACETPGSLSHDPFGSTPVTSIPSGFTYKNYFCSVCNRDSENVRFWRPRLECPTLTSYNNRFKHLIKKIYWQQVVFPVFLPYKSAENLDWSDFYYIQAVKNVAQSHWKINHIGMCLNCGVKKSKMLNTKENIKMPIICGQIHIDLFEAALGTHTS